MDHQGNVVTALDEEAVRRVAGEIREKGVEAVAVCFYFGFVNSGYCCRSGGDYYRFVGNERF